MNIPKGLTTAAMAAIKDNMADSTMRARIKKAGLKPAALMGRGSGRGKALALYRLSDIEALMTKRTS